jgi:carotenoid 1,2-hydratase
MSENVSVTSSVDFNLDVVNSGYAWWYIDALSDDGEHGLTIIAFIGSVFSPYYFSGRKRGQDNPYDYCSVNVCLYGQKKRWTMTERRAQNLTRNDTRLQIGPSSLQWHDDTLTIDLHEFGMPIPHRVHGQIRLKTGFINERTFHLDRQGRHRWRPVAPSSRIEVDLTHPNLHWTGHAYFDRNWGDEPLEKAFVYWDWSRVSLANHESAILYHAERIQDQPLALAVQFDASGRLNEFDPPANQILPATTIWRMPRGTQCENTMVPEVIQTLEDTPFYSRSVIRSHLLGQPVTAVHESLSLKRFSSAWVQHLLPYRMPRR